MKGMLVPTHDGTDQLTSARAAPAQPANRGSVVCTDPSSSANDGISNEDLARLARTLARLALAWCHAQNDAHQHDAGTNAKRAGRVSK